MAGDGHGNHAQDDLVIAERRLKVADMYRKRSSVRAIAKAIGSSPATVARDIKALKAEWRKAAKETIEDDLNRELAGLDASEANLIMIAEDESKPDMVRISAEGQITRIRAERAKIKGLYAAQRLEVTGKDGGSISITDYRSELVTALNSILDAGATGDVRGEAEPGGEEEALEGLEAPESEG